MLIHWIMNEPSYRKATLTTVCLVALGAVAAAGCNKSEAAPKPGGQVENLVVAGGAKAETENFVAEIKPAGAAAAGKEGTVEVTLVPKGGYHTNAQYPYKFKLADPAPEGVTYPKPVLQRADGTFDEKKGFFRVPFVASKAGKVTIGGTLHLSVCSEANCIMDKVPLEVAVDVK
jgi:hypothetical protein